MNIALRKSMTLEQFLAWEIRQELKYEFDGIQPVAMNGVRVEHASIESNLNAALRDRLKGKFCRAFGSSLKIGVAGAPTGSSRPSRTMTSCGCRKSASRSRCRRSTPT